MVSQYSTSWNDFVTAIGDAVCSYKSCWSSQSAITFFRGHNSTSYLLEPGIFRENKNRRGHFYSISDEANIFYEFRSRAGSLIDPHYNNWDLIFTMQHFGLPTRLLDWTESFSVALYFALDGAKENIDIWMLDPYEMNKKSCDEEEVLDVDDLAADYFDYFVESNPAKKASVEWGDAVAIYPRRQNPRIAGQVGLFTLHNKWATLDKFPLDRLYRFTLDKNCLGQARSYLELNGVNDFTIFPDMIGLSALLKKRFPPQTPRP